MLITKHCILSVAVFIVSGFFYDSRIESSKILVVFPTSSRSHYIAFEELFKELAHRGHEVTSVGYYPQKKEIKNFRDVTVKMLDEFDAFIKDLIEHAGETWYVFKMLFTTTDLQVKQLESVLDDKKFQKVIAEEQFDLVMFEGMLGDVFIGLGAHFNCPTIVMNSIAPIPVVNEFIGQPNYVSFIPTPMLQYKEPMTFFQRVFNFLMSYVTDFVFGFFHSQQISLYKKYFPSPKYPTFDKMKKNVSLSMVNYHFSQGDPRPSVPALIQVGGLQVKVKTNPLPIDLKKWMDEATDGVVYMSMGSNVKSSHFSPEKLDIFIKTFKNLKQRVVWKFEDDSLPGLPPNVFISKWLPQDDLLAHPNMKIFITHAGLGSILEAKVRAVPVIGIPIFADQISNIALAVSEKWGISQAFTELTQEKLTNSIQEILSNSSYKENVQQLSNIFLDRPQSALETGVYWVEYVLRHHGAKHIQSNAVHLNFFQLQSFDVIAFLSVIVLFVLFIQIWIIKCVWRKFFGKKKSLKNKNE